MTVLIISNIERTNRVMVRDESVSELKHTKEVGSVIMRKLWSYTTRYGVIRSLTVVVLLRIRSTLSNLFEVSVIFYDLRIRNPFLVVLLRIRSQYTTNVYDLRISPFSAVNDRLRACVFDLGGINCVGWR
jgi:hypothetical protein